MKVVIAIDEMTCAREAVRFVTEHTWDDGTDFSLIHVVSPVTLDAPFASYPTFLESISQAAQEDGRHVLRAAAKPIKEKVQGATVRTDVLIGHPTQVVVSHAKEWNADMIILGTHLRRGMDKFFFGSVSSDVASAAPCSVVILKLPIPTAEEPTSNKATTEPAKV